MSSQLKDIAVYSGTTIMGDGQVALILDVMGLAHSANVITDVGRATKNEIQTHQASKIEDHRTLLVAGIGPTNRVAIDLAQITRLEQINRNQIEIADGREVVQYRGEILSLVQLSEVLGMPSSQDTDNHLMEVVVYTEANRTVGIVVDRIIDIVDQPIAITKETRSSGRLLSAVVQDQVTDLVDLPSILSQCL
ncbi:protein containing CheW-like protein domain protein [Rhodopirellula europaea 6C]|uniref:histidine kinase n=1 Tax=Rhodopirellula europaea 6C TaxID=1263867 RepID=M2B053_9BACT|nr:protein containing CheW-like protein domain protein [Rhodopirellula europaea 6C]